MKRFWLLGLTGLAMALAGVNCPRQGDNTNKQRIAALRGFGSAEELRSYLADQARATNQVSTGLFGLPLFGIAPVGAGLATDTSNVAAPEATGGDRAGETAGDPFSTTNVQEVGVDESDIVKNDGQYIYVLDGSTIHIVQAAPPEGLVELSKIDIEATGDSLYLNGARLVALSRRYTYYYGYGNVGMTGAAEDVAAPVSPDQAVSSGQAAQPLVGGPLNDGYQTTVTIINVSDPAAPSVEATLRFEGNLASSRLIGSLLHLVLTTTPRLPDNPTPAALAAMPLEDWIPDFELVAADGTTQSGDVAGWESFFRPENPDGYGITLVLTLDVQSPTTPFKSTAISANAGTIYASPKALYVTDTNYDYTSNSVHTDTVVHKLAFTPDGTAYRGSGLVPGRLLNQYSLGEYQDYLRVATTVDAVQTASVPVNGAVSSVVATAQQTNSVYVLGESFDATLTTVGKIEGLAPGEQIYSARFVGKRGFLVTFRRVDPLFTLDLSDPANPTVAGLLKVPGYSDHIQLLDDNHLLTIGKDAQDAGSFAWIQGVLLSVFDVTDPANPALLHKEVIGGRGTDSEANHNPKAFNYFAAANALAFPADVYTSAGGGASWGQQEFTGLYVYRVTVADGFQLLGRIASSEGLSQRGCFYGYYGFTRGVFIGNTVYSVTQRNVKASALDAVETLIGQAVLSSPPALAEDCFGVPDIILPAGAGLR